MDPNNAASVKIILRKDDGTPLSVDLNGEIVNGEKKRDRLKYIAEQEGLDLSQTVAIGDGANDLPMIKTAGLGVAFHAKPLVQEEAGLAVSTVGLDGLLYILGFKDR